VDSIGGNDKSVTMPRNEFQLTFSNPLVYLTSSQSAGTIARVVIDEYAFGHA